MRGLEIGCLVAFGEAVRLIWRLRRFDLVGFLRLCLMRFSIYLYASVQAPYLSGYGVTGLALRGAGSCLCRRLRLAKLRLRVAGSAVRPASRCLTSGGAIARR